MRVIAVLTVHNRRDTTLRCLDSIAAQRSPAELSVVLCDDGSTDGTGAAVAHHNPDVVVVEGDGERFYSGGMRLAWQTARPADPDFYWLVNDDTVLDRTALERLLREHRELSAARSQPILVVGTTGDPAGGYSYGGVMQRRVRRMRFDLLEPGGLPRQADTMNANCVLVPRDVVERIGIIDEEFVHSMGDYDYGLRATAAGCEVWVAPGTYGECAPNPGFVPSGTDAAGDWRRLRSVRNLPPAQWRIFARRWGGPLWPVLWGSPYLRRLLRILRTRNTRATSA